MVMHGLPLVGLGVMLAGLAGVGGTLLAVLATVALPGAVVAAVHHAEVVAHRVGEPFGTLVLALAVTVIEVALILSLMLTGTGGEQAALPRDTLFAAVMIIANGVVGLSLLMGGLVHGEQSFRVEGTGSGLAALVGLSTLVLVLPTFTTSSPEGTYTTSQLVFTGSSSLALWLVFVFFQTVRHRDYFLPAGDAPGIDHAPPPPPARAAASAGLLVLSLVAVVGLAKLLSPTIEALVAAAQAPRAAVGIVIALMVLAPETWAALRAARSNRLQTSMNLAFGSALASIGLTVPVVVAASVWWQLPLVLGLEAKDLVLLALTFVVCTITLGSGRTNLMQGAVHLVIFAAFLFLALVP